MTEPWVAMPSTRYSSPWRKRSSVGTMYMVAIAKASPTSPVFMVESYTESGCFSASGSRTMGCSTMFQ